MGVVMATVSKANTEGGAIEEGDPITALAHAPDHALAISAAAYLDRHLQSCLSLASSSCRDDWELTICDFGKSAIVGNQYSGADCSGKSQARFAQRAVND